MANKAKFVSDFRSRITTMLTAMDEAEALANVYTRMGWAVEDFEGEFQGTDITAAEFITGVNLLESFRVGFAETIATLSKLML